MAPFLHFDKYTYNIADQSDYTYSDHPTIATDINGVQTVTGIGTGTGLDSGFADWSTYSAALDGSGTLQALDIASVNASNGYAGVWTQNYSNNTLNPISQDTAIISTLNTISGSAGNDTGGATDTMTAGYLISMNVWAGRYGLFTNGQDGTNNTGLPRISFNTGGNPSLGQIGSPTVVGTVQSLQISHSARAVAQQTFTQPTWVTATVWACRAVYVVSFAAAGALYVAGYGVEAAVEARAGIAIVQNGEVIASDVTGTLSHAELAARAGVLVQAPAAGTLGVLSPGAEAITFVLEGGELQVFGSMNFGPVLGVSDLAFEAIKTALGL